MSFFGNLARELNFPIANADFRIDVDPPYGVYFVDNETNVYADGKIVYSEKEVDFYLYHTKDDINIEWQVESYFVRKGIIFEKQNTWIAKDKLTETHYTFNFNKMEVL